MTPAATTGAQLTHARDKFSAKRTELAAATLNTLAELGYARTSLREIAQHSEYSHGVLHYYFTDKLDLIVTAVRHYEAACVTRYDEVIATATSAEDVRHRFCDMFVQTLVADAAMHRLFYDLRNQCLFDDAFRADILDIDSRREDMIWRVICCYSDFRAVTPAIDAPTAYILFDGIFARALLRHLAGRPDELDEARRQLDAAFDFLDHGNRLVETQAG